LTLRGETLRALAKEEEVIGASLCFNIRISWMRCFFMVPLYMPGQKLAP